MKCADRVVNHPQRPSAGWLRRRDEVIISDINLKIRIKVIFYFLLTKVLIHDIPALSNQNLFSDAKTGDVLPHILQPNCALSVSSN